jgi:hypothetical protein
MIIDENYMLCVSESIRKLRPNANPSYELACQGEQHGFTRWEDPNGSTAPSWDEVMEQYNKDQIEYASLQYTRDRMKEYPPVAEQLDMIWHSVNNGLDLKNSPWFTTIKTIKEKFPK